MKLASLIFAAVLAVSSFAGPLFACDASVPNGVSGTALTIIVPNCTFDNYTPADATGACDALRGFLPDLLTEKDKAGKTYTAVTKNDDANFIIDVTIHETKATKANDDPIVNISFVTRGLGKTEDGHTLFTATGDEGNAVDAIDSTSALFTKFVDNGWNCN